MACEPPAEARARYLAMLADATRWVTDPCLGDPGALGLSSRADHLRSTDGALEGSVRSNYFDNLALVDRTLRDLRGVMQRAGVWDSTVVLVTSDHPFRPNFFHTEHPSWPAEENAALGGARDPQIPFILKLSEQTEGVRYDAPFNTVVTHDLLLALMRREVSTPVESSAGSIDIARSSRVRTNSLTGPGGWKGEGPREPRKAIPRPEQENGERRGR